VSLAVIVSVNALPAYQRDDWRGVAHALPAPASSRVIIGERYSASPLSIYLGTLSGVAGASVTTRELDFVALRLRRTGTSPTPAVVPTAAPPGFRVAAVSRAEAFAVARFVAPRAERVSIRTLRRLFGTPDAEIYVQRPPR
jgi:hypothetical protein